MKNVPSALLGEDARSVPPAGDTTNETTTKEQRQPSRQSELSSGPKVGENGEYQPAKYEITRGFSRGENMSPVEHKIVIEDF